MHVRVDEDVKSFWIWKIMCNKGRLMGGPGVWSWRLNRAGCNEDKLCNKYVYSSQVKKVANEDVGVEWLRKKYSSEERRCWAAFRWCAARTYARPTPRWHLSEVSQKSLLFLWLLITLGVVTNTVFKRNYSNTHTVVTAEYDTFCLFSTTRRWYFGYSVPTYSDSN